MVRPALITGNHDLEGADFETDEDNLKAWQQVCSLTSTRSSAAGRICVSALSCLLGL